MLCCGLVEYICDWAGAVVYAWPYGFDSYMFGDLEMLVLYCCGITCGVDVELMCGEGTGLWVKPLIEGIV